MKLYRSKRKSCAFCKPHKMGWAPRYKAPILAKIRLMEKTIHAYS